MVISTMDGLAWLRKPVEEANDDLRRDMIRTVAETLLSAEATALCNADSGEGSAERPNRRNGYRTRPWDTRAGSMDLAIPTRRQGS